MENIDIAIITDSKSNLNLIQKTINILKEFRLCYSLIIAPAHIIVAHLKQCIQWTLTSGVNFS